MALLNIKWTVFIDTINTINNCLFHETKMKKKKLYNLNKYH